MRKLLLSIILSITVAFQISAAGTFTVTTTNDNGAGSLREAMQNAITSGSGTVSIQTTGTITLASALPVITVPITVIGTNASGITISGNNAFRVFEVNLATGTVTFKNLNIINGVGDGGGGGIFATTATNGKVALENCSISGCNATGSQAYGGAICASADVDLLNCTLTGNTAADGAGAIEMIDGTGASTLTINHSTITQNSTPTADIAGGIDIYLSKIIISNSIVGNNTNGGAGLARDISLDASNSNTQSSSYNLYTTNPFTTPGAGDLVDKSIADLGLSPLANNGGGVKTMALTPLSLALNSGTGASATDARGLPRDASPDRGAYEVHTTTDIVLSATAINEKVATNSTVGTLSSTNVDNGYTFTYTLVSGTGDTDNASFNISGNSLRITNSPDYNVKNSYTVRIRTTNQDGFTYEEAATITINKLPEAIPTLTVSVATPGGLSAAITAAGATLDGVVNLTITGTINATDFKAMRDNMPQLAVLDMSGANIVAYNGTGGTGDATVTSYPANEVPQNAFCTTNWVGASLTSIALPTSITSIGQMAFADCIGLSGNLFLPSLVTSIGEAAFFNCTGLTSTTIPSSVTYIGPDAIRGSRMSVTVDGNNPNFSSADGALFNKLQTTLIYFPISKTGSYTIPSSVSSIGVQAFSYSNLTTITIPSSVTSIGAYAFSTCMNLSSIYAYRTTPVNISASSDVFYNVYTTTCTLYVPTATAKGLYGAADQWMAFTHIVSEPTVTAVSPVTGSVTGGTAVTITGTNLNGATAVNFGTNSATNVTVISDTKITAVSPAGSGTTDITVTTAGGTSATSSADHFTYMVVAPVVTTGSASSVTSAGATLNGSVNANNASTAVTFEYGLTDSYGTVVTATPSPVTGSTATAVSSAISGLLPNTTYHFKVNGVNTAGTTNGQDQTFKTLVIPLTVTPPTLTLSKVFDGNTTAAVTVGTLSGVLTADLANVSLTATATYDNSNAGGGKTITVVYSLSGSASGNYSAPANYTVNTGEILPTVDAVSNQVVMNGASTTAVAFSGGYSGTVFNWTNDTPGIGLAARGTGDIPSFTAINTGVAQVVATVTVTPTITTSTQQTFYGSLTAGDAILSAGRLFRDGYMSSVCGTLKSFPGNYSGTSLYYDTYSLTNTTGQAQCVTVSFVANGTGSVEVSAYNGSFNPSDISANYLADAGNSSGGPGITQTFSFNMAAGATVVLVANTVDDNTSCSAYTITVTGLNNVLSGTPKTFTIKVNPSITAPTATTTAATSITSAGATLNGTINANNAITAVAFEYGLTIRTIVPADQSTVTGNTATAVSSAISGLAPNTTYYFRVNGVNSAGTTNGLDETFTTSDIVPNAPTIGTATAGNRQASVSFTAPVSNGGSTITGYTVTSSPGGLTGIGTTSPIAVTGLTNGTAYTFTVTATNSVGTSSSSTASNSVTPATVPGAPTIGTATAGDGQASVSFTAPASNGGSTITGYTVTSNQGNFTGTGTSSPIAVAGLSNGTAYTFTVTATNSVGTSSSSTASNSVTPATVPGAPTIGTATAGDGQASVSFTAPASNGGSAITGYTVTSNQGGFTGTGISSPIAVTGLTNGTAYTFTVTATNAKGTGAASSASNSVTPLIRPTITGISPSSGPIAGGTSVVITGAGFSDATAVKFGSTNATSFAVNSATQITAMSPVGSTGAIDITVTAPGGTSSTNTNDRFTYVAPPSFTSTPVTTVDYNQAYNYNIAATTEGSLATTITAPTLPAWLTLSGKQSAGIAKTIGNIPAGVRIGGVVEDDEGNIYAITTIESNLNTIYKIDTNGTTTIWKSGLKAGTVDNLFIANGYIYIPREGEDVNSITKVPIADPNATEELFVSLTGGAVALTEKDGWIYASIYNQAKIVRINESTRFIEGVLTSADGIPSGGPFGLSFDQNGNLFIATHRNLSVLKYNESSLTTVLSNLPNSVTSVKVDKQGNFYVALWGGGLRKYKPNLSSYELVSLNADDGVWGLSIAETGAITYYIFGTNLVYHLETGYTLQGTPAKSDVGPHNVVLRATNSAGYTDQTFTVNVVDNVAPVVNTYSPVTNATNIDLKPTLSLTFDEEVSLGSTGVLSIYNGVSLVKSYDLSVAADKALFTLSADKKTVSITLTENLPVNTVLSVGLGAGFVKDKYDNNFAGFTAASNTWQFTTVNKVAQTITYPAIDAKTYGDADFTLGNATTDKGLTVTYTAADPTVVSITGNQATILKAGNTNIIATQTGDNATFAATQVEHSLSVSKALLTVKADNKSKVYDGQVADNFTVTYIGFVKDETATALTGTLSFTGTAVTAVTAGLDYVVTPSGYSSDNYTITYENGKLDISKRPITLIADAKSKTYGDADPSLTVQVTSGTIVTGDNASGSLSRATGETAADYAISQGTYTYGSNYDETYVSKNLSITKRPLSVTAKIDSKTYDGTTKSSQTPIVGALVTGDAINVVPIQLFDNANVGSNHVLTPSGLTLKNGTNNVTDNYLITYNTLSTGVITAKQLTISNPTVTINKTVDGNASAAITNVGTLTGVETTDANNVTVAAVANYNNAAAGTGKTITVVYTLSGSAKGNYIAPANYVITNGKISDVITLSPLLTPSPGCEGSGLNLDYSILTGTPKQYKITFDAATNSAGIQNVAYTDMPSSSTSGTLMINVPKKTIDGTYHATLVMRDELGVESPAYSFTFTINLSADYLLTKFNRIIFVDNSSKRFTAYQWYKDGVIINGATKQSYNDPAGLVGAYSVQVTDTKGNKILSCSKVLNLTKAVKVIAYPSPVKASQTCTVQVSGLSGKDLENAELSVYTPQGVCIYQSSKVENLNYLKLPSVDGVYIGQLKTTDGDKHLFKIVVIK